MILMLQILVKITFIHLSTKVRTLFCDLLSLKVCNGKHDIFKLSERNLHILKCKKFEREGIETSMCLTLMAKEVPSDSSIVEVPLEVKNFLDNFVDMVLDELPSELPPLRDI